jgi:hypothetical protein
MGRADPGAAGVAAGGAGRSDCGVAGCALATSGVGRASSAEGRTRGSVGGAGAAEVGAASAAVLLRPSLLASRRSGEGPGGGVDGVAIPGMGRSVAAAGTEPAAGEVGALRGSAPARPAAVGLPSSGSLGVADSPTESDSFGGAWDTPGLVPATPAGPAAGGAVAFGGCAAALPAGGATGASGASSTFGAGGVSAFTGSASALGAGGKGAFAVGTSGRTLAPDGTSGAAWGWVFDAAAGGAVAFD